MKRSIFVILLLAFCWNVQSQHIRGVKSFYKKFKKEKGSVNFVLPGFVVWLSTGIANESVKNPETKAALQLARKFKSMRMLVMEDASAVSDDDFNQLVHSVKQKNYEELITVREKGTMVHIMASNKKDKLKRLLILVKDQEEGSLVMMNMKTNIRAKDLNVFINEIMKSERVRKKFKEQPKPKEEELPKEKKEDKKKKKKEVRA